MNIIETNKLPLDLSRNSIVKTYLVAMGGFQETSEIDPADVRTTPTHTPLQQSSVFFLSVWLLISLSRSSHLCRWSQGDSVRKNGLWMSVKVSV